MSGVSSKFLEDSASTTGPMSGFDGSMLSSSDESSTKSLPVLARTQIAKWILLNRLACPDKTDMGRTRTADIDVMNTSPPLGIVAETVEAYPNAGRSLAQLEYSMALLRSIGDTSDYVYEHGKESALHSLVEKELANRSNLFSQGLSFLVKNLRSRFSDDAIAAFARASAEHATATSRDAIRNFLVSLLRDEDPVVVDAAVIALSVGELSDPAAIPYLRSAAELTRWPTLRSEILATVSELEELGGAGA